MPRALRVLIWVSVALVGAMAVSVVALRRGEAINAVWLVTAALCCYALGYRFYSKFVAARVLALDSLRATPAERLENGRDFVPTNTWVVYGHHFAAIAGPGPLVGPVLAAQFGYLPGSLWMLGGAVFGGQWVSQAPNAARIFTLSAPVLAGLLIIYGFAASAAPVWVLLAPRDYLSTFVKLGTIAALAAGILAVRPTLHMPALSRFIDGSGPIFAGSMFPFAFITIACGAISGFHSLISSGTTPKLITREPETRMVGYGGMMAESFVAVMAMIAACTMQPGQYFAVSSPAGVVGENPVVATATITSWGFPVTAEEMSALAKSVGEQKLFNRTGGAPAFALGMAHIFSRTLGGESLMAIWYHFAIMFEALFILTILDAGTRVGRFMLQDALGHIWRPLGRTSSYPSIFATSALIVGAGGYFLWQGVLDPLGGINSLWPLFGISNQLLAVVAFCVATTILVKMKRARYIWVTLSPLLLLVSVTFLASYHKIMDANPRIGFLAHARSLAASAASRETAQLIFNDRIDALLTGILVFLVALIVAESAREWVRVLSGRKVAQTHEAPFIRTRFVSEAA